MHWLPLFNQQLQQLLQQQGGSQNQPPQQIGAQGGGQLSAAEHQAAIKKFNEEFIKQELEKTPGSHVEYFDSLINKTQIDEDNKDIFNFSKDLILKTMTPKEANFINMFLSSPEAIEQIYKPLYKIGTELMKQHQAAAAKKPTYVEGQLLSFEPETGTGTPTQSSGLNPLEFNIYPPIEGKHAPVTQDEAAAFNKYRQAFAQEINKIATKEDAEKLRTSLEALTYASANESTLLMLPITEELQKYNTKAYAGLNENEKNTITFATPLQRKNLIYTPLLELVRTKSSELESHGSGQQQKQVTFASPVVTAEHEPTTQSPQTSIHGGGQPLATSEQEANINKINQAFEQKLAGIEGGQLEDWKKIITALVNNQAIEEVDTFELNNNIQGTNKNFIDNLPKDMAVDLIYKPWLEKIEAKLQSNK